MATVARAQIFTTYSTVATNAYFAADTNSCAIQLNNLTTVGNYQFIAYYDVNRRVMIGRRAVDSSVWQTFNSGFTVTASEIADDHNVIAIAVDSAGYMHMSWDMHNQSLKYAVSNGVVTNGTLPSLSFTTQTIANAPMLFPNSGTTANSVTYPVFYDLPDSDDLLFLYRNGGAGGGSGNGNQYFNRYDPTTRTWTNTLVIDGEKTSVNAYLNSLAFTSAGDAMMSWTWRATPNWQSNSNILFARTPDAGAAWFHRDGTTQYTLPIIQSGSPASSVAEVIKSIPQNSSFINQTSMSVDGHDNPLIATYLAPNPGDPNRQYVLVYFDGSQWRTSQVSRRTSDTAIDASGSNVRDLGRPVVLVDDDGRVLVVTRSEDTAMGAFSNPNTPNNGIVVYYNTVDSLNSASPAAWKSVTLDSTNMGAWEPTYDRALWESQNKLALFFEPLGLTGQSSGTIKVLEWDEPAYFAHLNLSSWNLPAGGSWNLDANWSDGIPNSANATASFGDGPVSPAADTMITLTGAQTLGALNFSSPTYRYTLTGGYLSLDNGASNPASITVAAGHHTIESPVTLPSAGASISTTGGTSLTLSGNLSGTGGLTKSGAGALELSGTNSYLGPTVITAGVFRLSAAGALPSTSNLSVNGGTLELTANLTRAVGVGAGQFQLPGAASTCSAATPGVTLTLTNSGTPITWGGAYFAPSTLTLSGGIILAANLNLNGAARSIQVTGGDNTLAGALSGATGSLQLNGPGALVLNTPSTYGGGTTLNSFGQGPATLRAAATNALGAGTITLGPQGNATTARLELAGGITLPNSITFPGRTNVSPAILNYAGDNTLVGQVTLTTGGNQYLIDSAAGSLTLAGTVTSSATAARNLTLQGTGDGVVIGVIQNGNATLSLTKSGSGTWTLRSVNTYTGLTTITSGMLAVTQPAWQPLFSAGADIQSGRLLFDYTNTSSPLATVESKIAANIIRSSTADSLHTLATYDDHFSLVTVMYTLTGDLNLNGQIDPDDYALLDRGYARQLTGYSNGDVNRDGVINLTDYALSDRAFASQFPLSPDFLAQRESQFGSIYVQALLTTIPEPALPLFSILYLSSSLLCRRRRLKA